MSRHICIYIYSSAQIKAIVAQVCISIALTTPPICDPKSTQPFGSAANPTEDQKRASAPGSYINRAGLTADVRKSTQPFGSAAKPSDHQKTFADTKSDTSLDIESGSITGRTIPGNLPPWLSLETFLHPGSHATMLAGGVAKPTSPTTIDNASGLSSSHAGGKTIVHLQRKQSKAKQSTEK